METVSEDCDIGSLLVAGVGLEFIQGDGMHVPGAVHEERRGWVLGVLVGGVDFGGDGVGADVISCVGGPVVRLLFGRRHEEVKDRDGDSP